MNGDDENWKELVHPPLIETIRRHRVCFYPGHSRGRKPELEDFVGAMPLLGNCDALVFAEPRRSRAKVREKIEARRGQLALPVSGGFITCLDLDEPEDYRSLFVEPPGIECVPPEAQPKEPRLWLESAQITFRSLDGLRRDFLLVIIGIGGLSALVRFFHPHKIGLSRIIGTPF